MTEADRIKRRLREAISIEDLRRVWESEQDAIQALPEPLKMHCVNLKDVRKTVLSADVVNWGAG